jgi:hypothetical protein
MTASKKRMLQRVKQNAAGRLRLFLRSGGTMTGGFRCEYLDGIHGWCCLGAAW